jgi:hypothetical protein
MHTVRCEDNGLTLRLFMSEKAAQDYAVLLAPGALERFLPQLHDSGTGWYVADRESGRQYDAAGLIERPDRALTE